MWSRVPGRCEGSAGRIREESASGIVQIRCDPAVGSVEDPDTPIVALLHLAVVDPPGRAQCPMHPGVARVRFDDDQVVSRVGGEEGIGHDGQQRREHSPCRSSRVPRSLHGGPGRGAPPHSTCHLVTRGAIDLRIPGLAAAVQQDQRHRVGSGQPLPPVTSPSPRRPRLIPRGDQVWPGHPRGNHRGIPVGIGDPQFGIGMPRRSRVNRAGSGTGGPSASTQPRGTSVRSRASTCRSAPWSSPPIVCSSRPTVLLPDVPARLPPAPLRGRDPGRFGADRTTGPLQLYDHPGP